MKINPAKSYKGIFIFFILLTLGLIGFVVYTSFSQAIITIYPKQEKIDINFDAKIRKTEDLLANTLKGKVLQVFESDEEKITNIPQKETGNKAEGKVTLHNNSKEPLGIVGRTQLESKSTGIIFRTQEMVSLPAGGKIEVKVQSDLEGAKSEIGPDKFTLVKLSPEWQKLVYGESKDKFAIKKRMATIVTQELINQEKEKFTKGLVQRGLNKMESQLESGEKIPEKAKKNEIIEEKISVAPETETNKFTIYIKVKITAIAFDESQLYKMADDKLKKKATESKEYLGTNATNTKYEITSYNLDQNAADIKVYADANIGSKIKTEEINKEKLLGRNKGELEAYLANDPRIDRVEVLFSPFWTKRVPTLKDHIEIIIKK